MKYLFSFSFILVWGIHIGLAQWISINPGAGGQVQDVVADPGNVGTLYLASDMEGVYKTTDNGEFWQTTGHLMHNRVYAVAIDPKNSDRVYIGTLYGLHISDDGGETYRFISATRNRSIASIAVDPENSNNIIAATGWRDDYDFIHTLGEHQNGKGELFLSEHGGETWDIIFTKENAQALVTRDWYDEWADIYTFRTKGGPAAKGNTIVVNYYHHTFQLGYGIFKGTIQADNSIVWEDWTGDLHFPGSIQSQCGYR